MKRNIAWIIVLVLLSSLLSGCGSNQTATSDISVSEILTNEKLESEEAKNVKTGNSEKKDESSK